MDIAREVDSFPDIARLSLETEKGLIGGTSSLLWVETHFGSLMLAIDSQDFGIEIEDYRGDRVWFHQKMTAESVVEVLKGGQTSGAETFQKPPQGGRIWISGETGQKLEDSVLLQEGVGFDPAQSKDNWVKDSKDGIADGITIVELSKSNSLGESRAQFDLLEKLLKKV